MSTIRGIPTKHMGVNFRSRIEARWAEFFTLMGWPWTYEPFDLEGYIPDFVLELREPVIVEVKGPSEDVAIAQSKIECCGWSGEALVVSGDWPTGSDWHDSMPAFGFLAERQHPDGWGFDWDSAILFYCLRCRRPSFLHSSISYKCRVGHCYDGDGHAGCLEPGFAQLAWREAGNRTQWRAA